MAPARLLPWHRAFLTTFCRVVLPGPSSGRPDPALAVPAIERHVAGLHALHRLGFMALFDLINLLALLTCHLRPMTWLETPAAGRYLERLERSRVYAVRGAFTAVKALAMLVTYGDPAVEAWTGYRDDCLAPRPQPEPEPQPQPPEGAR